MGAGRTFFCLFCLGLATLLTLQKRQSEVVSRLGQTRQSLDEKVDKSEQMQNTMELSLEKSSSEIPTFEVSKVKLPEEKSFVQPELSELAARYKARRELVARVCQQQSEDLEARFSWEGPLDRFPMSQVQSQVAGEDVGSGTGKGRCAREERPGDALVQSAKGCLGELDGAVHQAVVRKEGEAADVATAGASSTGQQSQSGFNLRCSCTQCGRPIGGRLPTSRPYPTLTSPSLPAGSFLVVPSLTYSYLLQASL